MKTRSTLLLVSLSFLQPMSPLTARQSKDTEECPDAIPIRIAQDDHDPYYVCLTKLKNERENAGDATLFAIHGFVHNARVYEPGADWIFEHYGDTFGTVYTLDLPGHGKSSYPQDIPLGQLSMELYTNAVQESLRQLHEKEGITIDVIMGHSMGGMVLQMLQNELRSKGTSLAAPFEEGGYGIPGVVLLAPTLPEQVPWSYADGTIYSNGIVSDMLLDLLPYIKFFPQNGALVKAAPDAFLDFFFTLPGESEPVPNAPQGETLNQMNDKEPFVAALQLAGLDVDDDVPFARPFIDQGIFAADVQPAFAIAAFKDDPFMLPEEEQALYRYLGAADGDVPSSEQTAFIEGGDEDSPGIHDCIYTSPDACLGPAIAFMVDRLFTP